MIVTGTFPTARQGSIGAPAHRAASGRRRSGGAGSMMTVPSLPLMPWAILTRSATPRRARPGPAGSSPDEPTERIGRDPRELIAGDLPQVRRARAS